MVDAQTIGVLVTAVSVTVAAIYYMITLRETTRNRKVTLTNTLLQAFSSEEGFRRHISLLKMEWSDWDDFVKKYDSDVNEENFVKRAVFSQTVNYISYLVKEGLIDIGSVYELCGEVIMENWLKLQPIYLKYVENGDYGRDFYDNIEYIAKIMIRMKAVRDPKFRGSAVVPLEEYERIAKG